MLVKILFVGLLGETLFVGTTSGSIQQYRILKGEQPRLELVQQISLGRKKIEQIEVVSENSTILVLQDGTLNLLKMDTLEQENSVSIRSAQLFCFDLDAENTSVLSICVAAKKKLHYYQYYRDRFVFIKEISLSDSPKFMAQHRNQIFIVVSNEYQMMSISQESKDDLNIRRMPYLGRKVKTEAIRISSESLLVNMAEDMAIVLRFDGQPDTLFPGAFPVFSENHYYFCHPFLLFLEARGRLSITAFKSGENREILQTMNFPSPIQHILAENYRQVPNCDLGYVVVLCDDGKIFLLEQYPIDSQLDELWQTGQYDEAKELIDIVFRHSEQYQEYLRMAAARYFFGLKFDKAFSLFLECNTDPREILAFFPHFQSDMTEYQLRFLEHPRHFSNITDIISEQSQSVEPGKYQEWRDRHILEAIRNLREFLEQVRESKVDETQESKVDEAREVDTALLKLYAQHDSNKAIEFLQQRSFIDREEIERFLYSKGMYGLLAIFHEKNMDYFRALTVWTSISDGKYICDNCNAQQEIIRILSDLSSGKIQSSQSLTIIEKFTPHILQISPHLALKIFMIQGSSQIISPEIAIQLFNSHAPRAELSTLKQKYLEFILHQERHITQFCVTELVLLYLEKIHQLQSNRIEQSDKRFGSLEIIQRQFLQLLDRHSKEFFNMDRLLIAVTKWDLFEECLALQKKMENYMMVIQICIKDLRDFDRAENYCEELHFGLSDQWAAQQCAQKIFELYLRDPELRSRIKTFLTKFGELIDPRKAIQSLPDDMSLSEMLPYLTNLLRQINHSVRQDRVAMNLLKNENLQVMNDWVQIRNRSVTIHPDTPCEVCKKKILVFYFAAFPNGVVVHYKCIKSMHVCPIRQTSFIEEYERKTRMNPHHISYAISTEMQEKQSDMLPHRLFPWLQSIVQSPPEETNKD